jgi:ABC-2 type transport system permease protein
MSFYQQWIALKTIMRREFLRFIRIWIQTVLPPVITVSLYFIIFGKLIDYIVPGLILMSVISNSYANVVSSFFSAKFHRSVEEMIVSPLPNYIILLGYVSGGVLRGVVVGITVTAVSMFFSELHVHSFAISLAVFVLTAALFSLAGFINAVYGRSFDDITIIPTFVLTPLTYLGGIFYSIKMLPEFWQGLSQLNPILYMINAFRYGLIGVSDIDVSTAFLIILGFTAALFWFALTLLNRGIGIKA